MSKAERRWLKVLTVMVSVLLIASITPLIYTIGGDIYRNYTKSRKDELERNAFSECAYIAQANMNCYDDERQIADYVYVVNWYEQSIGYCFFFDKGGYALVTSYDYALQKFSLDEATPFPEVNVPESARSEVRYVYSVQPVIFVLPDDGYEVTPKQLRTEDTPSQYRIIDAGSCFCYEFNGCHVYSFDYPNLNLNDSSFDALYIVYPGAGTSKQSDVKYFTKLAEPDAVFRNRMLEVAQKQMIETGHDSEEYKNQLFSRMAELADSKKDSRMMKYMPGLP